MPNKKDYEDQENNERFLLACQLVGRRDSFCIGVQHFFPRLVIPQQTTSDSGNGRRNSKKGREASLPFRGVFHHRGSYSLGDEDNYKEMIDRTVNPYFSFFNTVREEYKIETPYGGKYLVMNSIIK